MLLKERAIQYKDSFFKDVFSILARATQSHASTIAGDTIAIYSHSLNDLDELKELMFSETKARHIRQGITFSSAHEAREDVFFNISNRLKSIAGDNNAFNYASGIGTSLDPNTYNRVSAPVMLGPMEQANLYSNGGLAGIIIDKKSMGMIAGGVTFKTFDATFWTHEKILKLEEAAELTGYNAVLTETVRDCLVFGGCASYPVFKNDSITNFLIPLDKLNLQKDCIERWVVADRWNIVFVPSFIITAEDYLKPETVYLPLGGYELSTSRVVLMRPKKIPYWSLIHNLGWTPSDYTGYIRSLYAYMIVAMSIPIMAQQMSLLLYQMPLDAITAQLGAENVKKLMAINEEKMKEWSVLSPKAVNIVGELNVVNRQFSGFEQFFGAIKSDLAATCGITEPILFHTPNKGFSDNTQEALLKDSEMMRLMQRSIEPQLIPHTEALIAHTFGQESKEWEQRHRIWISFDKPIVSTQKDLAEVGARFAASVSSLALAGIPADIAVEISAQFFKEIDLEDSVFAEIHKEVERVHSLEERGMALKKKGGGGHSLASPGNAGNVGTFTRGGT